MRAGTSAVKSHELITSQNKAEVHQSQACYNVLQRSACRTFDLKFKNVVPCVNMTDMYIFFFGTWHLKNVVPHKFLSQRDSYWSHV